ncbi:MAG: hypothetical protein ACYC6N_22730 [Pirellulaceae bacterium]
MIVGFRSDYTPVDDFDTLFTEVSGITEADSLAVMKNTERPVFDVYHRIFDPMTRSDLMPRWIYDDIADQYTMSMNIYAFSSPSLAGTGSGVMTFSEIPEPSSIVYLAWAALLVVPLSWVHKRKKAAC